MKLLKKLKISKLKFKSDEMTSKADLMNKLSEDINENKKKLKYREEDYLFLKNKKDQISKNIENLNLKLQELNTKKKECFNQINKITREMSEGSQQIKKDKLDVTFYDENNSSNYEKIKNFQQKAKNFQYEINEINSKLENLQQKFKEVKPKFESLDKDYNSLNKIIEHDEERLNLLKKELKESLDNNMDETFREIDIKHFEFLKSPLEIEMEIQDIENQLDKISASNNILDEKNPHNLDEILSKLKEIEKIIKNERENITITHKFEDISNSINDFRKLEFLNQNLEDIINRFLVEINLKVNLQILINNDYTNFSIKTEFTRSKKEIMSFNELTTPEKVFFLIILCISIQINLNFENIVFSNLILPNEYNKRGSVYRTLRKIIPVFEKENSLKSINLVFVISNLEMKKSIENLKIITIEKV